MGYKYPGTSERGKFVTFIEITTVRITPGLKLYLSVSLTKADSATGQTLVGALARTGCETPAVEPEKYFYWERGELPGSGR